MYLELYLKNKMKKKRPEWSIKKKKDEKMTSLCQA